MLLAEKSQNYRFQRFLVRIRSEKEVYWHPRALTILIALAHSLWKKQARSLSGSDGEMRMILSKSEVGRDLAFSLRWCLYGFYQNKSWWSFLSKVVNVFQRFTIFAKSSTLVVRHNPKHVSDIFLRPALLDFWRPFQTFQDVSEDLILSYDLISLFPSS